MITNNPLKRILTVALLIALSVIKGVAGTVIVSSAITTNTTWTSDNQYLLTGIIYVKNNATLTIQPGTVIKGDSATLGSLIITRSSKLISIGTPTQPIVFTSSKAAGTRKRGDWGGVILLGYAPVNWPGDTGHIEGIAPNPDTRYGGGLNPNCSNGDCPDPHDNSGIIQYTRIEFAGVALSPNNEINGLTFGGVGDGTTIDHVQVSYSNDDSYEWFGGTVTCKYLVAYDGIDDDFDTDNGYSGKGQFFLGMRDPNVADVSGSKTFESDNDPSASTNLPQTSVVFGNVTGLGGASITVNPLFRQSAHLRRNTNEKIYNSIMMGFPQGILIDGPLTIANCAASSLVKNCYVQQDTMGYLAFTPSGDPNQAAATTQLNDNGNAYSTQYSGVLANPDFPITNIADMVPASGNPLQGADNSLYNGDGFFTNVSYIGAFNPAGDTWANDWTNFDPQNANYTGIGTIANHATPVNIFPNPATETLQVTLNAQNSHATTLQITDISGRILMEQENAHLSGSNVIQVNVSQLENGVYFVRLSDAKTNSISLGVFVKQ